MNRTNDGFVLILVLVAIVVVGVALQRVASHQSRLSIESLRRQSELQAKWGRISCTRAVLPFAGQLLAGVQESTTKSGIASSSIFRETVFLGGHRFDLLLADESAKANLNVVHSLGDASDVRRELRRLVSPGDFRATRLAPREIAEMSRDQPVFASWGDVFDFSVVRQVAGDVRQLATITREITIFGDGQLNLMAASDGAALAIMRPIVEDGQARRVLDQFRRTASKDLDLILQRTVTNRNDRDKLLTVLATNSSSYSMWIEVTSKDSRQQFLSVQQTDRSGLTTTKTFAF